MDIYCRTEWILKLTAGCEALATVALSPGLETVLIQTPFSLLPKLQLVWNVVPNYPFPVIGNVQPPVGFSWSGPFGTGCN